MESPKNKMIKETPRKKVVKKPTKVVKPKKDKEVVEEVKKDEEPKPLTVTEDKEVKIIQQVMTKEEDPFLKFSRSQIDLIKTQIAKGATDDELKLFIVTCKNYGLDPFARQIHFIQRWNSKLGKNVGTIQIGIDGFRAIAESGGQYAGSDDAVIKDEKEIEVKGEKITVPGSATVTVHKLMGEVRYPFTATARWNEYYTGDKQGYMWHKMPYGQLSKCAESLALRKAFPKLLSGLYSVEEMDQAKDERVVEPDAMFRKAVTMIKVGKDIDGLEGLKEKMQGSDKYDDNQKKDLIKVIDKRIKELIPVEDQPKEDDNSEATS